MKTVVIDKSARRITIRRVEGLVNGRNDCQDNELSAVLPPKEDHSSKRKCNVSKICPSSKDIGFTNGVEWKTKAIPLSLHAVTSSSSSADEVQSSSSDPSDGNLSRKLTALERLKNLTFDVPQVRLQPLVSDQAQKARHASGELTGSSTADRSLSESLHGRNKQSFYRRRDRDIHRSLQDGRKRDDVHCAFSSSDHSSHRSGGYRHDQQSSHLRRPRSPIAEPWLPRGYNGCHLPRQNVICSNADFPLFHASVDVAPFRETVFNWEKLPALEFSESDLSACTTTELEVVAKFVLHRRASLARCTAIMADEVSALQAAVETQKRWCEVLNCLHACPTNSSINQSKSEAKQGKTADITSLDREVSLAAARLASSLAKQAQARTQALPSRDVQMNSLCNAFFNGMISAMLDRINGKEDNSVA
uniref:Uncharacterized protein n=1 Tax=Trichuris muris TaxID=70415 RepID=A0A5S6Q5X4_TRIMR